jgi:hypothetical protein
MEPTVVRSLPRSNAPQSADRRRCPKDSKPRRNGSAPSRDLQRARLEEGRGDAAQRRFRTQSRARTTNLKVPLTSRRRSDRTPKPYQRGLGDRYVCGLLRCRDVSTVDPTNALQSLSLPAGDHQLRVALLRRANPAGESRICVASTGSANRRTTAGTGASCSRGFGPNGRLTSARLQRAQPRERCRTRARATLSLGTS